MKTKRLIAVIGILALLTAMLPVVVSAAPAPIDYKPVDVGPEIRGWEATPNRIVPKANGAAAATATLEPSDYPCYLDTKTWLALDNYNGAYFFTDFYLIAETDGAELWVQADLSYPEDDPRDTPIVTCEQAAYLLDEFDNNMYPVETSFFGFADLHDGSSSLLELWGYVPPGYYANSAGRQVVLVSNVRDDNYFDPDYPNYIAGFYSPSFEAYFDRNIMSIDSHQWEERVGPDGARPYLYESVFAHEYQHLLHDDYDPDEVNWINEGLSMFSEFLTGYVVNEDAYSTFQELPENSLTAWGDQGGREIVSDYGIVFLFQMYLYEKFGQEFIQYEFNNPDNDITSITSTLAHFGIPTTFGDIYHDFALAVLMDSEEDNFRYGFDALEVEIDVGPPGKPNPDAYNTPGAPPWGADYIVLNGYESVANFKFNGFEFNPTLWTSDGSELWGGEGDLIDNWAIFETTGGGTLTFDTMYNIEEQWDFGFVQVSTDGGSSWTSLTNAYTVPVLNPDTHPNIIANGIGLTGDSEGWVTMSFDLSAYPGSILIGFRYMTDWAYNGAGWYIDNVYVDATEISDGSSADAFTDLNEVLGISNEYTVFLVGERNRMGESEYEILEVVSGGFTADWLSIRAMFDKYRQLTLVVIYDAPEGVGAYADYTFELVNGGGKTFKNK